MDIKDQIGTTITLPHLPNSVVCLVPSLSETLVDMGLLDKLVGVTKFCIHPSGLRKATKTIGGTKNPRISAIINLKPDLIIANKEENRKEDIEALRNHCPVYVSDIKNIGDTTDFMEDIQKIFSLPDHGAFLKKLSGINQSSYPKCAKTCYLIWKDPYMTVGTDTFIHHMMEKYGFENIIKDEKRYPEISIENIQLYQPDLIMLSSEPYPFKSSHIKDLKDICPESKVILVDGELFSWYGTRLLKADQYLKDLRKTFV